MTITFMTAMVQIIKLVLHVQLLVQHDKGQVLTNEIRVMMLIRLYYLQHRVLALVIIITTTPLLYQM